MQLTIFTDYGLRSLMYLAAHSERYCSVKELAEYYGISRNHLVKVVHRLAQIGYIISTKGKNGGIKIAHEPEYLKLGEVVRALEPNMDLVECFNKETNTCCLTGSCQIKLYLYEARQAFLASLNKYSLADAIKNKALFFTLTTSS